jgi:hypothetical protein
MPRREIYIQVMPKIVDVPLLDRLDESGQVIEETAPASELPPPKKMNQPVIEGQQLGGN